MTTRKCVQLPVVTFGHVRDMAVTLFDRRCMGENPMPHAHFTALFVIDAELLLAMDFLHCTEADLSRHVCIRCVCT